MSGLVKKVHDRNHASPSLKQKLFSRFCREDAGAIAVISALLFSFLFIAILILVVDGGSIYNERRQLQKVADAAVTAIAQGCYTDKTVLCLSKEKAAIGVSWPTDSQLDYVNGNSNDQRTKLDLICGNIPGRASTLASCSGDLPGKDRFDCRAVPDKYPNYVRIRVSSLSSSDENFLTLLFSEILGNTAGRLKLEACAQAVVQVPFSAPVVYPLLLTPCKYEDNSDRQYSAWYASDPVSNPDPSLASSNPQYCAYKKNLVGAETSNFPFSVPLGTSLIKAVNGVSIGCPTIEDPVYLSVGDLIEPVAFGEKSSVADNCSQGSPSALDKLGITGSNNFDRYDKFLEKYINDKVLYLPVAGEIQGSNVKIGGFITFAIRGIYLKGTMQTGCGKGQWDPDASCNEWRTLPGGERDCPKRTSGGDNGDPVSGFNYCIYGVFKRSVPPQIPRPTPSPTPTLLDFGLVSVSLIP